MMLMALFTSVSMLHAAKKVHMLGDSTMAPYDPSATITRGWGMYFGDFLTNGWTSTNYALGGRDARSGYNELWLTKAKDNVEAGDYVIIQFAHNDEMFNGADHDELYNYYINNGETATAAAMDSRGTKPSTTYRALLKSICDEVKAKGATPILVGPACRFYFGNDGKIRRNGRHDLGDNYNDVVGGEYQTGLSVSSDDHTVDYAYQMQQLASTEGVAYLDLTQATKTLYEDFGKDFCESNLQSTKVENNVVKADGTHFRTMGALLVAKECAELIANSADASLATLKANVTVPTGLNVSPTAADMGQAWAGNTIEQEFTINGFDLSPESGNITVSATGDVELSTDKETWTTNGLTLPYVGGTIVQNVYARVTQNVAGQLDETVSVTLGSNIVNIPLTAEFLAFSGGDEMSVTWSLASNGTATTVGEATAAGPTVVGGGSQYNGTMMRVWGSSAQGSWTVGEDDDPNRYVEFSVTAPAGKALDINNIEMKVSSQGTNNICCHVYYSTDDFATRTTIYAPVAMTANVDNQVSVSPVIQLAANETVKVRIYPWSTSAFASGKYLGIKDVVISGQSKDDDTPVVPATVSYSLGSVECQGTIVPDGEESTVGANYTIATNKTLYKEGYTLTGWTDGTNTYNVGKTYVLQGDLALTPVFTQNTVTLDDRTAETTLNWNFRRDQGAPTVAWQNTNGNVLVTQATICTKSIDVPIVIDTNPGKFNNANNNDWVQTNIGTTFTIPSAKGALVSMEGYQAFSTTTIDGNIDYTSGKVITDYEISSKEETIQIVIGTSPSNSSKSDCQYMRYIQVTLPVPEALNIQEKAVIDTDFQDWTASSTSSVVTTAFSNEEITFTYDAASVDPNATNEGKFATTTDAAYRGYIMSAKSAATVTSSAFSNITKVRFRHGATGSNRGWGLKVKGDGDEDWVTLSSAYAQTPSWVEVDVNRQNVQLQWYNLNTGQNAYMFELEVYSNVVITAEQVTLTTSVSPSGAGSVTVKPSGTEFDEDTEIKVTATKNFGYRFVEWQDANNTQVSTDAEYTFTISENTSLTAVFEAVPTYKVTTNIVAKDSNDDERSMGSITLTPNAHNGMYEAGTQITATASTSPVLSFTQWEDNSTSATREITVNDAMTITANYEVNDFIAIFDASQTAAYANQTTAYPFSADAAWDSNRNAKSSIVRLSDGEALRGQGSTPVVRNRQSVVLSSINGLYQNGYNTAEIAWQYQFSTVGFTTATFTADMAAKNAATKNWKAQYSVDGTTYNDLGDAWVMTANVVKPLSFTLPADAIGKETVYLRIFGTGTEYLSTSYSFDAGTYEGLDYATNSESGVGNVFILGDAEVVADEVAPVVVSTVPADNATGSSASGKITVTFDEKIYDANSNGAVTLTKAGAASGTTLTPSWSTKSVSFNYSALDYGTQYTFTMPANYVQDHSGNKYAEQVVINFTTMERPSVAKAMYDFIVPDMGTIDEALAAANNRADKTTRYRIFIKNSDEPYVFHPEGTVEGGDKNMYVNPISILTAANTSFIGESIEGVILTNVTPDATWDNGFGAACPLEGIGKGDVLQIKGADSYFQNLTIKTSMGDAHGRDIAVNDFSNRTIFKDACLWGYQDTYVSNNNNGKFYFEGGVIRGRTDYMCGKGDVYYNRVTLRQVASGYAAVPSLPKQYGYIYQSCKIVGDADSGVDGTYTLGRPWGKGTPIALFIDTEMEVKPSAIGWSEMSGGYPARFAEYGSHTPSGAAVSTDDRKTVYDAYDSKEGDVYTNRRNEYNNPILTAEEAAVPTLAAVMGQDDDWQPTLLTEQAPVPTNVSAQGMTLSWDDSNYALLWAVCKDGNVIDFTTTNSYEATEAGQYSVRAANEMGGLSAESATVTLPVTYETITFTGGVTTYVTQNALDFTGVTELTAYAVTEIKTSTVATQKVGQVPAGTPLLIKGASASIPVIESAEAITNLLQASDGTVEGDGETIFAYSKSKGKFAKVSASVTIPADKAYLVVDGNAPTTLDIDFEGEATGINNVNVNANSVAPVKVIKNGQLFIGNYNVAGAQVK